MIQRIQTIFLFLVVILMSLTLVFGHWGATTENETIRIFAFFAYKNSVGQVFYPYLWIGVFGSLSIVVAIAEIFLFKNRVLQMKMGLLNSLLLSLTVGSSLLIVYITQKELDTYGAYEYGIFFPLVAIILNRFATRFIKKDEDLVRSVDRIR